MQSFQIEFIELARRYQVLQFGEFTLKSGRVSPYFFNAGNFNSGKAISVLGKCYAQALLAANIPFDMLFGAAYKGIPLAVATAAELANTHSMDIPVAYNRKEAKSHGEGGILVGAPLQGRIVIIDDVITAGTAVREVLSMIKTGAAETCAILLGLNRQERGSGELSAIQEIEHTTGIPVISIITLDDILEYLRDAGELATLAAVRAYRDKFGV